MFEDSLMESGGKLKTKSKYWSIATFAVNGLILAALIIWPSVASRSPTHADDGHAAGCSTTSPATSPATSTSGAGPGQDQV